MLVALLTDQTDDALPALGRACGTPCGNLRRGWGAGQAIPWPEGLPADGPYSGTVKRILIAVLAVTR